MSRRWQQQPQQQQTDKAAASNNEAAEEAQMCPTLSTLVIQSANTLQGTIEMEMIDLTIPDGWSDKPPILTGPRGQAESLHLLKGVIRKGIPPPLRCAIWLSNIIQAVHPHQECKYWHEYRTLQKVRALDYAYETLLRTMVSTEDTTTSSSPTATTASSTCMLALTNEIWKDRPCPTYGRRTTSSTTTTTTTSDNNNSNEPQQQQQNTTASSSLYDDLIPGITERGAMAQKRVLIALERVVWGMVEYAPLLPIICALLLMTMSESYAFTAIREMVHVSWYMLLCCFVVQLCL